MVIETPLLCHKSLHQYMCLALVGQHPKLPEVAIAAEGEGREGGREGGRRYIGSSLRTLVC